MRLLLLFKLMLLLSISLRDVETYYVENNACSNMIQIRSIESINLPQKYITGHDRPWLTSKLKTRLYSSQRLAENWRWFKNLKIQGINSTFSEVLQILDQNDCFFVGYGSGIKSILLGTIREQSLLQIAGETTCESFKLHEICSRNFGFDNCGIAPKTAKDKIIIGNFRTSKDFNETLIEPITLFSWGSVMKADRLKWGFTVDECGLLENESGDVYFIDYTAQSQMDICEHSIKIPVQHSYWQKWTENSLLKILQVYNLVVDGFTVEQREYQFFIDFVKTNFNTVNFQEYFCSFLYGGKFYPWISQTSTTKIQIRNRSQCHFLTPDSRRARLIRKVNQTLQEDFGDFWHQNMTTALIGMLNFEDNGIPQNPFMNMFTVNHRNGYKTGLSRTRNAFRENERMQPHSGMATNIQTAGYPSSEGRRSTKTVQVTLKVDCNQNVVTIENRSYPVSGENVQYHHSPPPPTQTLSTAAEYNHPTVPPTIRDSFRSSNEKLNIEKTQVLAQHVPDDEPPLIKEKISKEKSARIWNSWNSATPNPSVRHYKNDEIQKVLATDY